VGAGAAVVNAKEDTGNDSLSLSLSLSPEPVVDIKAVTFVPLVLTNGLPHPCSHRYCPTAL